MSINHKSNYFRSTGEATHRPDGSLDTQAYIRALTLETALVEIEQKVLREMKTHD